MFGLRRKRELLHGWLWEMYARSCREEERLKSLGLHADAGHYASQARTIGNLLARMTQNEHEITR